MIEHLATNHEPSTPPSEQDAASRGAASAVRAEHADRRLGDALRELRARSEDVVEDLRAVALPVRVVGGALLAGLGAVLLVIAARAAIGRVRRPRPRRSVKSAVGRSLAAELATRAALGAAGVLGAHLANDVLLPALTRRLAAENDPETKRRAKRAARDFGDDV